MGDLPSDNIVLEFTPNDQKKIIRYGEKIFALAKAKDRESELSILPRILQRHDEDVAALALKPRDPLPCFVPPSNRSIDLKGTRQWLKENFPAEYHAIRMHTLAQLRGIADGTWLVVTIPLYHSLFPTHKSLYFMEDEELEKELRKAWRARGLERPDGLSISKSGV